MQHIHLSEVGSTNSYLRAYLEQEGDSGETLYVTAYAQTAGRGQRGNSWEANPGQNLSLSLLLHPKQQDGITLFDLNRVTSLALHELLTQLLPEKIVAIKWPNDLYVGEKKIAGILTENEWEGAHWKHAIIGVGLNVLQHTFHPYHPAATSLLVEGAHLAHTACYEAWHHPLATQVVEAITRHLDALYRSPDQVRGKYLQHLYRYQLPNAPFCLPPDSTAPDGLPFRGTIIGVTPEGLLQIDTGTELRHFAFKQVQFL